MLADPAVDDRLALLLAGLPEGVLLESDDRRLLWANSALAAIFGVTRSLDEFVGVDCDALARAVAGRLPVDERFADHIRALIAERRPVHSEEIRMTNGSVYERDYIPLELNGGSRAHLFHYRDVTQHHRLREQHQADEARLAAMVSELAEARDLAVSATEAKSEFLAVMSHEIRTPMNGVVATVELLREGPLSAEQHQLVDVLGQSADSLLAILDDILDFSKIEAGKIDLRDEPFFLVPLAESAVDVFAADARSRGIALSSYVDPSIPARVSGDAPCVRQVLMNLVGNAVKFSDGGEVTVKVTPGEPSGDRTALRIVVSDAGPGIPAALAPRLFEPFVQGETPRTGRHGGTGLGLVICDRLTRLMGGGTSIGATGSQGTMMLATLSVGRVEGENEIPPDALYGRRVALAGRSSRALDAVEAYLRSWQVEVARVADPADRPAGTELTILDARGADAAPVSAESIAPLLLIADRPIDGLPDDARALAAPVHRGRLLHSVADLLAAPLAPGQDELPAAGPGAALPLGAGAVLVAEDDAVNRMLILRQLARLGVPADAVEDGERAVAAVAAGDYALVLMDCRMPGMNGYEAARAIRRAETDPAHRIPIVALTDDAAPREHGVRLAAGVDDCLAKPLTLAVLRDAIQRWVAPADAAPVERRVRAALGQLAQELGGRAEVAELVDTWLAELPGLLGRLERAGPARDLDELATIGHRLTSSAAIFGAVQLAEECRKLERDARDEGAVAGRVATVLDGSRELAALLSDWRAAVL